jgi:hypothetical protein
MPGLDAALVPAASATRLQIFAEVFHVFDDIAQPPGYEGQGSWIVFYFLQVLDGLTQQVE